MRNNMIAALRKATSSLKRVLAPWRRLSAPSCGGPVCRPPAGQSLLLKAMGDDSLANRLITHELNRAPEISWSEAVSRANDRWERDLAR